MTQAVGSTLEFIARWFPFNQVERYDFCVESLGGFTKSLNERLELPENKEWTFVSDLTKDHADLEKKYTKVIKNANTHWYTKFASIGIKMGITSIALGSYLQYINRIPNFVSEDLPIYLPLCLLVIMICAAIVAYKKILPELEEAYNWEAAWATLKLEEITKEMIKLNANANGNAEKIQQLIQVKTRIEFIIKNNPTQLPQTPTDKTRSK